MHRSLGARCQLIMSESGSAEDSQEKPDLKALGAQPVILTHERENIYEVLSTANNHQASVRLHYFGAPGIKH